MLRLLGASAVVMLIVGGTLTAQTVTVTSTSPPEAKLAAIDARSPAVTQASIREYARLLDALDRKCQEPRVRIADFAAKGVQLLAEKRVTMTHLRFLRAMNDSMPDGADALNLSCAEIAALLITMTNN